MISTTETKTELSAGRPARSKSLPMAVAVPRLEADDLHQLAAALTHSRYAAAQELTQPEGPAPMEGSEPGLATLRQLFWRGEIVPEPEASEALRPMQVTRLVEADLLQVDANGVRALFQIQVYRGLFFIVDFMLHDQPADLVLPIGPSGRYLETVTIRRPVDSALDLGCGCGIQSLMISRHARHVTATDINPRALALTRMNATMNGASNVKTLQGSYFEPVAGRTFDLLVANLPYVITPENKYVYRDLGSLDDLPIRKNVEQVPLHLNEGGFAHVMLNWIYGAQEAWHEPIARWTTRRNVDAWLIYSHSKTAQQYTQQWITVDEREDPGGYARTTGEWLSWYEAQHIERLAFGLLMLRRRTATNNWRCALEVKRTENGPLGGHILHLFENQDRLAGVHAAADLLHRRLRRRLMTIEKLPDGSYRARTTRGLLIQARIDRLTARTISLLDAERDLRTCIRRALLLMVGGRANAADLIAGEILHLANVGMIQPAA